MVIWDFEIGHMNHIQESFLTHTANKDIPGYKGSASGITYHFHWDTLKNVDTNQYYQIIFLMSVPQEINFSYANYIHVCITKHFNKK